MKNKHLALTILIAVVTLGLMWIPFFAKSSSFWGIDFDKRNMQTIVANFDGINFLIVAKSLYDPKQIEVDFASILSGRQNLYFSAHYPGFPIVIRFFDIFLSGPNALLASIVISNVLLAAAIYAFFSLFIDKKSWLVTMSVIALFVPARMLSMRIVGSNESLFIFLILSSVIANYRKKHLIAAIAGGLAILTRSPGILLYGAYMIAPAIEFIKSNKISWKYLAIYSIMPLTLIGLWGFYGIVFGDYLAYFRVGGNINLYFPPFTIFGTHFDWVSGMWLEDIIYTYIFYSLGIYLFFKNIVKQYPGLVNVAYFASIYMVMIFCVVHRDIARYALPIAPIVVAGYSSFLESRYTKYILLIIAIPIMLYSWNFIISNVQPVMDWSKLL